MKKENKKGTALAVQNDSYQVLTPSQIELIKRTVAKGATDDELDMFLHFCKQAGVDPLRKQAHFIVRKRWDKDANKHIRDPVMKQAGV